MTEETVRGITSIIWVVAVLVFYAFLVVGVVRLLRWLAKTVENGVQTSRYQTMRAQGKSDAEIEAVLDEPLLDRHWWVMPVAAVIVVFLHPAPRRDRSGPVLLDQARGPVASHAGGAP